MNKIIKVVISDCFGTHLGGFLHEKTYFLKDQKVLKEFVEKTNKRVHLEEIDSNSNKIYVVQKDGCTPFNVSFHGDVEKAKAKCQEVGHERMGAISNVLEFEVFSCAEEALNRDVESKKVYTASKPWG